MNIINPPFKETVEQRTFRQNYLKALHKAYKYDESIGIMDIGEDKKISLQDIYIQMNFSTNEYQDDSIIDNSRLSTIIDLFENNKHIIISGKPGSGKTTLSRSIINNLCTDDLTKFSSVFGRRLPLYFKLRDYKIDDIKSYDDFFNQFIISISNILKLAVTKEHIEFYLQQGWCFLIFDGVDEVGSKVNRLKIRNFILKKFNDYNKENYILVTSRPAGIEGAYFHSYTEEESSYIMSKRFKTLNEKANNDSLTQIINLSQDDEATQDGEATQDDEATQNNESAPSLLNLYHVTPFSDNQISEYSKKWFRLREENPDIADEKASEFISSISTIKNLATLRRRPVFLSMMIHIHTTKGKLPYSRAKAYQYMVEAYIEHIDIARRLSKIHSKKWSFEDKERVLEELAYKLHSSSIQSKNDETEVLDAEVNTQIILSKKELEQTIKKIIEENLEKWQEIQSGDEKDLLEFYLSRTGLLHEPEENKIQFSHLSFQEYLTAHRIYRKVIENPFEIKETIESEIIEKLNENKTKWNEVILLFFSLYKDATQTILEKFGKNHLNNLNFISLIIQLTESTEYGIKESDIKSWAENIINFIITYNDNKTSNTKVDSENFALIVKLFNNNRLKNTNLINYIKDKLVTSLKQHEYDAKEMENLLYLISYDKNISHEISKLIIDNIKELVNNESLLPALELFSTDNKEVSKDIFQNLSLYQTLSYYETISPSSKNMFLSEKNIDWKQFILYYDWIISNLYGFIQLNRLKKKISMPSTINSYTKFITYRKKHINAVWNEYWYPNIWHEHPLGHTTQLNHDILSGRYEFYLDRQFYRLKNKNLDDSFQSIRSSFVSNRKTKKATVLLSIFILSSTTQILEKEYDIDLSIPWQTFNDFKNFSNLFKDYTALHRHLEVKLDKKIDKKYFIEEMSSNMKKQYSIDKMIDKILKNEEFYITYNHDDIINTIKSCLA